MADVGNFFKRAVEAAEQARRLDDDQQWRQATDMYISAVQAFDLCMKHDKSSLRKEKVQQKRDELYKRAVEIKDYLNGLDTEASGGAAAAQKKRSEKDKDEKENEKLRGALSGAILKEKPNVKWDDVAGLESAKCALKEAVVLPVQYPQLFTGNRRPWRGILLYGPPGTGKTHLARAVATAADATFYSVSSADLMSKWLGESEKLVRELFELARETAPSIVFVDEVDSLCGARTDNDNDNTRRVKTEFLVQMQGLGNLDQRILVLGATNTPWSLDSGIRRRFERRIYIPLPEPPARSLMFRIHLGETPNDVQPDQFEELGRLSDGFSGSDISVLVRGALMEPVRKIQDATHFRYVIGPDMQTGATREDLIMPCSVGDYGAWEANLMTIPNPAAVVPPPVTFNDFLTCLMSTRPSVSQDDILRQISWTKEFGQEGS